MVDTVETGEKFFAHYGKMGMHWGRRSGGTTTTTTTTSTTSSSASKTPSSDHQQAQELKTRKLSTMSNAEVKTLNTRMQLELAYKSLNAKPASKTEKFIKKVLGHADTAQKVYNLANSPMVKAGMLAINGKAETTKTAKPSSSKASKLPFSKALGKTSGSGKTYTNYKFTQNPEFAKYNANKK